MKEVLTDYGSIEVSIITDFAKEYRVTFPPSYIELLSKHNGVHFVQNDFDFYDIDGSLQEAEIGFCCFGDVGGDSIENSQDHDVYGYENIIVFGFHGNGDYICFDYRQDPKTDNPPVVLMHHDEYIEDEQGQYKMAIAKIADSFDEFIDMLYRYVEE